MSKKIIDTKQKPVIKKKRVYVSAKMMQQTGEYAAMPVHEISFSSFNYRGEIAQQELEQFAEEVRRHGVLSPLTVRLTAIGGYELVAGERRLRAAALAKLETVPVIIKNYSGEEVVEIQLAENLQRDNPHPLREAQAISQMQKHGRSIEEIEARLGKYKGFVYSRLKILSLIHLFRNCSWLTLSVCTKHLNWHRCQLIRKLNCMMNTAPTGKRKRTFPWEIGIPAALV